MANQYVKWRKDTFENKNVDLLEMVDAVMI